MPPAATTLSTELKRKLLLTILESRHGDLRVVVAGAQPIVVEGAQEQLLDQLSSRAAAAAMGHVDAPVLEIDGPDVFALLDPEQAARSFLAGSFLR